MQAPEVGSAATAAGTAQLIDKYIIYSRICTVYIYICESISDLIRVCQESLTWVIAGA